VHSALGPGLLESACEACLAYELAARGFAVNTQVAMPLVYEGVRLDTGDRIDLIVNRTVLIEVKAVSEIAPVHIAQVLSYLKLSGLHVGLLLNFHVVSFKQGIKRFVLD
jgi:GxxExxY protein